MGGQSPRPFGLPRLPATHALHSRHAHCIAPQYMYDRDEMDDTDDRS